MDDVGGRDQYHTAAHWSSDDQPGWQGAWPWRHHRRWPDHGRTCRKRRPQLFLPASTITQHPAIPDSVMPSCAVSAKVTQRLQMVLSAAARLVIGTGKYDITPVLCDVLHWLPVPQRTEFKIAVCIRLCPWYWPCLLQRCLLAGVGYCCSELSPSGWAWWLVCS